MALKKSLITNGSKWIVVLDEAPNTGAGYIAPEGSTAMVDDGGVGSSWIKFGPANTDWRDFSDEVFGSITTPLIEGGSSTTQTLTYKTTTGIGATGADHVFQVGNNGATEALRILNDGKIGIGNNDPAVSLDISSKTDALAIPNGLTSERPIGENGLIRYNSTTLFIEVYENGAWKPIATTDDIQTLTGKTINSIENTIVLSGGIVDSGTPNSGNVLTYNGLRWVPASGVTVVGSGITYWTSTPVITASGSGNLFPILTLSLAPVTTAEQTISGTGDSISSYIPFGAVRSSYALGRSVIDAGVWTFTNWLQVSNQGGTTSFSSNVFKVLLGTLGTVSVPSGSDLTRTATVTGGTPFAISEIDASSIAVDASFLETPSGIYQILARISDTQVTISTPTGYAGETGSSYHVWKKLFSSPDSDDINTLSPNYLESVSTTSQPAFSVTSLHTIGRMPFVKSTASRTLTFTYNGQLRNAHMSTPVGTLHNDLAGLNGGQNLEYYHSTLAEYTGSGTGVFARINSPVFISKISTPLIIGDGNPSSTLTYKTTTGVGIAGADHIFQVGNNGATEAMRILNDGKVGIGTSVPKSTLHVGGTSGFKSTTITSNYTADGETFILADATGGALTVNLPSASTCLDRIYEIGKIDSSTNQVIIDGSGSETINGSLTIIMDSISSMSIISNGTNWHIF